MKFLIILLLPILVMAGRPKEKISLGPQASASLSNIFLNLQQLHESMYGANTSMIKSNLVTLKGALEKGLEETRNEKINSQHINRLLLTTLDHINYAQNTEGAQQAKNLKDAFKQMVILYESYKIDQSLKVYFCQRDRSVWLQKLGKTQNPFEPKSNCGQPSKY